MPEDAAFLAAIAANPQNRLPRLVYADWLDERNAPRGELIRLEEETRERVAWDATLWRLKPRRNELRKQVDPDWLKAMNYGQDVEPLFRGQPFPEDWRDGWRLIREAHERWTGQEMPDIGGRQAEIEETERRLGLTLPPSLREYVAFAHDLPRPEGQRWIEVYRDPYTMTPVSGHDALSLIMQAEQDIHWAVLLVDLRRDDLPVHTYFLNYDRDDGTFDPGRSPPSRGVADFLFDYMCAYTHGYRHQWRDVDEADGLRRQLADWLPFHGSGTQYDPFNLSDTPGPSEMFEGTNVSTVLRSGEVGEPARVELKLWRPIPRDHVPDFIATALGIEDWFSESSRVEREP